MRPLNTRQPACHSHPKCPPCIHTTLYTRPPPLHYMPKFPCTYLPSPSAINTLFFPLLFSYILPLCMIQICAMAPAKPRLLPVLLLSGCVLLGMASLCVGLAYWEEAKPKYHLCVKSCYNEADKERFVACQARCRLTREKDPERARRREEEKEEDDPEEQKACRHRQDPEERARERQKEKQSEREEEEEWRRERRRREKEEERERKQQQQKKQQKRQKQRNPYYFPSRSFQTRFQNEHGRFRVLERFDKRSEQLRVLRNFRVVELESKPETLILPHHSDADYLILLLQGKAIFTIVSKNSRESYNVEIGDFLRIPAGFTAYVANRDNKQNLKIIKLAIPLNIPGQFANFYPSGKQNPKSYYSAFGKETLEATFNTEYEEIQKVLFGESEEEEKGKEESEGADVIVKLSKEQVRELARHAKSSTRGEKTSKSGPLFNLRDLNPRYSNDHGKFWESSREALQPLQDLGISVSFLDLNEGSLFLPHFRSKAIVVAQVIEGQGTLEIACPHLANEKSQKESEESEQKEEQQKEEKEEEEEKDEDEDEDEDEEEQGEGQIQRLSSKLSKHDIFVIPAGHPVALTASNKNNLKVVGFALNAENDQINFLGGERDNVINQIEREVKEVSFEGSGQALERLFKNQKESYFVNAESQQKEGGNKGKRAPLSSILGAFF